MKSISFLGLLVAAAYSTVAAESAWDSYNLNNLQMQLVQLINA